MNDRKRTTGYLLVLGIVLFFLLLAMAQGGCGMVAGLGRDLSALADGLAADSAANAAKIRH
jgi:predicted small secreted protein